MFPNREEENLVTMILLGTIILIAFVCFVVLLAYLFTTKKNKLLKEKHQMKSQFEQELLRTQLEIQEQTLKTISQEIHDNVGQVLSLAKLNLATFEETESEANREKINDTKQLVSKAINDLRDLSRSLHGDKIAELGLQESVANELKILQNTGQFSTDLKINGEQYKLEPQKEMVIFRIVQECLNNAIKHAGAKKISITISYIPESFTMLIADDGTGFDVQTLPSGETGIGLKSMRNRAALINAEFVLDSRIGSGTSITLKLKSNNLTS